MQNKESGVKVFLHSVKRIFRSRNVIIISDHKVDHVPLSGVMQVLLLTGLVGFFSGVSYITGSYMAASSVIREKDKKIARSNVEKTRIADEMNVLKKDLVRMDKTGDGLSNYSKFIASNNGDVLSQTMALSFDPVPFSSTNMLNPGNNKLLYRIALLEHRVNEIRNENISLIMAIRERTDKKIDYLQDIISMTGLDPDHLEHLAKSENGDIVAKKISPDVAKGMPTIDMDESAEKNSGDAHKTDNQGGPFIPYEAAVHPSKISFTPDEEDVLADVDRVVLLKHIVNALPLSQPMKGSMETGPFGRRIDPFNHRWAFHPGVDLVGPTGSKIHATNNGVVIAAEHKPAYGNMVDIEHAFGIVTRYAHMSKILVRPGDKIVKGQVIGIQGSTGRSTGQHLHYEVRINDHPVNPVNFLNAGDYVLEN